ncbi:hypothetical protein FB45DRAFT_1007211 [Roridomyces roridus]|uniref:GST N-terminal domain-containing protein n=1 Tax=Roridomyces roridus TaxID=1738132 RepID=A0AAD7FH26_9AGAR|nr:hypothetical protein FB45DRAFT_1007211 [Roridomyces roridus]
MSVILYRYDMSPFSKKISHVCLVKKNPQRWVTVSPIMPRSEITDTLGIGHRRIPILAIGRDVYLDTSLIASALERRFSAGNTYGTIFPPRKGSTSCSDAALMKIFSKWWADEHLFMTLVQLVLWDQAPEPFVADRATLLGGIPVEELKAKRPATTSKVAAQFALLEAQLADWPNFLCVWSKENWAGSENQLLDEGMTQFPHICAWMDRMEEHIGALEAAQPVTRLTSDEAIAEIAKGDVEPEDVVGFQEAEAARLGFKRGDLVSVVIDGPGNIPTIGPLIALNQEEIVIEIEGQAGVLRCHFPRVFFTATKV